jgi:uncharacterized protein YhbP (UPF0306 family)
MLAGTPWSRSQPRTRKPTSHPSSDSLQRLPPPNGGQTGILVKVPPMSDKTSLLEHSISRTRSPYSELRKSLERAITCSNLLTMGTVDSDGKPHVNSCFFASDDQLHLIVLTPPSTKHAVYASKMGICSVNIAAPMLAVGDLLLGVQLRCGFKPVAKQGLDAAFAAYVDRNPQFLQFAKSSQAVLSNFQSRFYTLEIHSGTILDESAFGRESYNHFRVEV